MGGWALQPEKNVKNCNSTIDGNLGLYDKGNQAKNLPRIASMARGKMRKRGGGRDGADAGKQERCDPIRCANEDVAICANLIFLLGLSNLVPQHTFFLSSFIYVSCEFDKGILSATSTGISSSGMYVCIRILTCLFD